MDCIFCKIVNGEIPKILSTTGLSNLPYCEIFHFVVEWGEEYVEEFETEYYLPI